MKYNKLVGNTAFRNKRHSWETERPPRFHLRNTVVWYIQVAIPGFQLKFICSVSYFVPLEIDCTAKDTLMKETCHKSIFHIERSFFKLLSPLFIKSGLVGHSR